MEHGEIQLLASRFKAKRRQGETETRRVLSRQQGVSLSVISYSLSGRSADMSCLADTKNFFDFHGFYDFCEFNNLTNRRFDELTNFLINYWLLATDYWILSLGIEDYK